MVGKEQRKIEFEITKEFDSITFDKSVTPRPSDDNPDDFISLIDIEISPEPVVRKPIVTSVDRDETLARVETEKRVSLIKAWEESEKSKTENKAHKKVSEIGAWEESKKASLEAELKKIEQKLEKKRAEYVEKMKNKIAKVHKEAEENKAMIEAKLGEDTLKTEESAAKYRGSRTTPKKLLTCFQKI